MRILLATLLSCFLLASCATKIPATKLERANVLPLQIDPAFQFRKVLLSYNQELAPQIVTTSEPILFEERRRVWGAVDNVDRRELFGNYFIFFWRTSQQADVTIRLEYRQAALGNWVSAQERYYPGAKGSFRSEFSVIGDEYLESGRVTSWRALLIVDGKIVALTQSFIWK